MQRWRIALVLAVVAASLAAAGPADPESVLSPRVTKDPTLYGVVGDWRDARLARLDPRSLRPVRGRSLELIRGVAAWAFSPARSRLALGTACQAGISLGTLQLVDLRRMRPVGCFALGPVAAVAWPRPDRLLVLAHSPLQIFLIDPNARRIVQQTPIEGAGRAETARAGERLLVLTGRTLGQPQQLVIADARGSVRSVDIEVPSSSDLVVDPSGRRAYVVRAATVADIDLATLAVVYHELGERASVLGRRLASFAPTAQAKEISLESRRALWVGSGVIASFGSDVTVDGRRISSVPVGLRLIDTRTWTARTVDEKVSYALRVGEVLLTTGAREIGLVAYDLHGTQRFQLFRGRSVGLLATYRGSAYVYVARRLVPEVVDVRTGRALGPREGSIPFLLIDED